MDLGASFHVTPDCQWFTSYNAKWTRLGNDFAYDIKGVGDIKLKFQNGAKFVPKDVQHVPKLMKSLILIGSKRLILHLQ